MSFLCGASGFSLRGGVRSSDILDWLLVERSQLSCSESHRYVDTHTWITWRPEMFQYLDDE